MITIFDITIFFNQAPTTLENDKKILWVHFRTPPIKKNKSGTLQ